jgi:hypothetical protein
MPITKVEKRSSISTMIPDRFLISALATPPAQTHSLSANMTPDYKPITTDLAHFIKTTSSPPSRSTRNLSTGHPHRNRTPGIKITLLDTF